jgi:phage repressor protein C with HTH and peptisase S24 domain
LISAGAVADPILEWGGAVWSQIPLAATSQAGEWGGAGSGVVLLAIDRSQSVGQVDRPASLSGDPCAYAVTIAGEAMWPRFRAGRRLLVSPAAAVAAFDDVLVELGGGKTVIAELARRTDRTIQLRQFNPDVTFEIEVAAVQAIHKVVGEAI